MSAMPERVQKYLCAWEGGLLLIDEGFGPDVFVKHNDYAALESRLLAAEARVREVEAERDGLARHIDRRADGMDPLTQALRAALAAAEARAKAMEDGPLDYMSGKCDRLKEQNATLRADLDALVPLLRYFVEYVEDGMYEWEDPKAPDHACDFLDNPESGYCEFHDKWGEARAILAREAGE